MGTRPDMEVRDEQIVAALCAGVPAEDVSAATGLTSLELEQIIGAAAPSDSPVAS